jgi:hypothetical protein
MLKALKIIVNFYIKISCVLCFKISELCRKKLNTFQDCRIFTEMDIFDLSPVKASLDNFSKLLNYVFQRTN